ncbi:MAG: hypothetical protein IJH59_02955, partial [Firmicutes bacterium]|nr:hypothetical protein [Bacillota bacterium]
PEHGEQCLCCSFGGQIDDTDRRYAKSLAQKRAAASDLPYLVACANCRDVLQGEGKSCVHILDLLLGLKRDKEVADLEQRLQNRAEAKERIVRRFFPEREAELVCTEPAVKLSFTPEVRAKLSRERIRMEDAAAVIAAAEASGRVTLDRASDHCFAHGKVGRSTVWTEYEACAEGYRLHNAYIHRMSIEGEDDK